MVAAPRVKLLVSSTNSSYTYTKLVTPFPSVANQHSYTTTTAINAPARRLPTTITSITPMNTVTQNSQRQMQQPVGDFCSRWAMMLGAMLGIICCGSFGCGCGSGKQSEPNSIDSITNHHRFASETPPLLTNQIGLVSIGLLNSADEQDSEGIVRFFRSNGIFCTIEGTVVYDVLVRRVDVEHVHILLRTNRPVGISFRSIWDE